jgi:hypothetical protein
VRHLGANLVETKLAQVRSNDSRGPELAVAELRMLVKVTSPGDDLGLEGLRCAVNL